MPFVARFFKRDPSRLGVHRPEIAILVFNKSTLCTSVSVNGVRGGDV